MPCNTFREAAALRGLLADDSEWHKALEEVATYASGKQLRELFAYILLFCDIGSPLDLWTEFREELADDFRHAAGRPRPTEVRFFNEALLHVDSLLAVQGKSICCEFPMLPVPDAMLPHGGGVWGSVNREINEK